MPHRPWVTFDHESIKGHERQRHQRAEMNIIQTDYLVVGAGATAMSFVDTLLSETDADVTMVDRRYRPGGHWNDAYPFVHLHQPSAYYGVSSRELSSWTKDKTGLNQGLYGLASAAEVLAHFEQVLQDRFLPSGRVRWVPMSEYSVGADGAHYVQSLTNGENVRIEIRKKLVDGTLARTEIPATHQPKFSIAPGVVCVPPNRLPDIRCPHPAYAVVGSGKTGMDACIWLIQNGVPPSRIRWIMSRDAWLLNREHYQPGADDFDRTIGSVIGQFEAIAEATSVADLFSKLEQRSLLMRIDKTIEPTTYRCAIVSPAELAQLQRIADNIVRMGHLRTIEPTRIVLDKGALDADPDTLYVDCSARALTPPPGIPVFDGDRINLLMVRTCQPLFSAAVIAFVESHFDDPVEKNALCAVVPTPERPTDWLRMWATTLANQARWQQNERVRHWLAQCRLNNAVAMMRGVKPNDEGKLERLNEAAAKAGAAAAKLPDLIASFA
jgi:hypothetical protein